VTSGSTVLREKRRGHEARTLRVLHVSAGNLYGGVETMLTTMARLRHLCAEMEPCFAVCFEGRLSEELRDAGVPVHLLGAVRISRPWTVWRARRRLRELLHQETFDAVVCHMAWPLVVFGRTARKAGKKIVYWAHGFPTTQNRLERLAGRTVPDLAISNSRFTAGLMADLFPKVPDAVVYCPVALPEAPERAAWRTAIRKEQGAAEATTVIVQVSRMQAWKGHLLHLHALAEIRKLDWVCWFAGGAQRPEEARYEEELRSTAERLGISDRIRFLGQRSDIPKLLAAADIFCQPNRDPEPFGIVFIEALWAGCPVVTTAMGGALEIVDESCGVLVEPGDAADLARALARLIEAPDVRERLGSAAPERARQLSDPSTQISVFRDSLAQVVRGEA